MRSLSISAEQVCEQFSYIDDFKLMMVLSLGAIPLVLLLRHAAPEAGSDHAMVME